MAVISVNLTDTFEQWRTKTNSLATKQGDLTTLTTTAKSTVVAAINEIDAGASLGNVVEDTTPQLGGSLDMNGNSIISVSNANITITPNGSGKVVLDGISHPNADGTNGQVLQTNGSGVLSFATISSDPTMGGDISGTASNAQIVANSVTATELAGDAVTGAQLADDACDSEHYTDGSIDTAHLADDAVTAAKLASNSVVSASIVDGTIVNTDIADTTITGTKLVNGTVTSTQLGNDSVTNAAIADNALNSEHYTDGSIDAVHIANNTITATQIAGDTITAAEIAAGAVNTSELGNSSVTAAKMTNDAVGVAILSATGTANSTSFLRGDNTWAVPGGGKLKQFKYAIKTTTQSLASGTATYGDVSGLSLTIAAASGSNIMLAGGHISTLNPGDHGGRGIISRVLRGSTIVSSATSNGSRIAGNTGNAQTFNHLAPSHSINAIGTFDSTATQTIKVQTAPLQHNTAYINFGSSDSNNSNAGRVVSVLWVMEIEP